MRRLVAAVLLLIALGGLAYFIHGANQVGVLNGLILNLDAWNDERYGLALMAAGAFLVLGALLLAACGLLLRLQREFRELRQGATDDAGSPPRLHPAP